MGLFGKTKDPKERVRELKQKMRHESRALDRQIAQIQREEAKVTREIKEAAKKGDKDVCLILAKSMLQARKTIAKIHVSKAQINSICLTMDEQLATMRMAGSLQKSTEVMRNMMNLVKVPEIMKTMREMSAEMMKLGIIDEMIEDTMESMDPADLKEEAEEEVENILYEITAGELGKAPRANTGPIEQEATEDVTANFDDMKERLAQLRS